MAAQTLDYFLPGIQTQDTKKRIETGDELIAYLQNDETSMYCEEMDKLIDGLAGWVNSSNYKVSLQGQEVLSCLIVRMDGHFKPHVTSVLPAVVDRLGDSKDQVRESARELLMKLVSPASSPQYVFDRLSIGFTHKLWKVKEEILVCLQRTVNEWGAKNLSLSKLVPMIVKLLEDQSIPVREQAVTTLVEIYRHVGERVKSDLAKKEINPSRLNLIYSKMDEVRNSGLMIANDNSRGDDDMDGGVQSQPVNKPTKRSSSSSRAVTVNPKGAKTTNAAGALDEETVTRAFEEVPKIYINSAKDVSDRILKIKEILSDQNNDWEKRQDALKDLRALFIAGASGFPDFQQQLRSLEPCLRLSVQDLRSQIVREACINISYMAQMLTREFDHVAEAVIPALVQLIPNSVKIMASSGVIALKFIVQYTHSHRLIPLITCNMTSKSAIIRRQSCELLDQMFRIWPASVLEKQIGSLQEALKRGLTDADPDARVHSRRAFWGFEDLFKQQANVIFNGLDATQQKLLQGVQGASSSSSSSNSINQNTVSSSRPSGGGAQRNEPIRVVDKSRIRSISSDRASAVYNLTLASAAPSRLIQPATQQTSQPFRIPKDVVDNGADQDMEEGMTRSNSTANIATGGASRVSAASNYNSLRHSQSTTDLSSPPKPTTLQRNASLRMQRTASPHTMTTTAPTRQKKSSGVTSNAQPAISPDKTRTASKNGMSQSQPGSRSVSPSSRYSYLTHTQPDVVPNPSSTAGRVRSTAARTSCRDASPSRAAFGDKNRRTSAGRVAIQRKDNSNVQKLLLPGEDLEAVANALQRVGPYRPRAENGEFDDGTSETSSQCSEGSYRSYGNTSEASIHERRSSLKVAKKSTASKEDVLAGLYSEDVAEIISSLSSGVWSERRDGLIALQNILQNHRLLSRIELKKVCEIFTRMFFDPHGKVFSSFLDTLVDFISVHRGDLNDWVFICLPRLINKFGADLLGSVQTKILRALDAVRVSFHCEHQFNIITKFIIDQTQNPNLKSDENSEEQSVSNVKIALLSYMHELVLMMDPNDYTNSSDIRLAVSRVITWTTEPKSADIRKAAQAVLIALSQLNPPVFERMLEILPKTFQEGANRIIQSHQNAQGNEMEPLTPRNLATPPDSEAGRHRSVTNRSNMEGDTENLNPEDLYNEFKKASANIQNLNRFDSQKDDGHSDVSDNMRSVERRKQYNPVNYTDDKSNGLNRSGMSSSDGMATFDSENDNIYNEEFPLDHVDDIDEIIYELSHHNERVSQRENALLQLIRITRDSDVDIWTEHFKTILLLLLETLADNNEHLRALSLRVLREIVRHHPDRFRDYAELTVLNILEAQKDQVKEVVRTAEECSVAIVRAIPVEQSINILNPFVDSEEFRIKLAAIKMQTKVVESITDKETMRRILPDVVPGLLKGYDDNESSVRKASVFCLVTIYLLIGDDMRPHLAELSSSKMKLLNLYVKRALAQKGDESSAATSKTSSPVSIGDGLIDKQGAGSKPGSELTVFRVHELLHPVRTTVLGIGCCRSCDVVRAAVRKQAGVSDNAELHVDQMDSDPH